MYNDELGIMRKVFKQAFDIIHKHLIKTYYFTKIAVN